MKAFALSLLVVLLPGCAKLSFPEFPVDVKYLYATILDQDMTRVSCGKYEIKSTDPLIYQFIEFVEISECQSVIGFKPDDFIQVENWIADAQKWAKDVRCKLK